MQILMSGFGELDSLNKPTRAHDDDAGIDLIALERVTVLPGQVKTVTCSAVGLADFYNKLVEESSNLGWAWDNCIVPAGFVWDKSGLAGRGITVLGGVIDKSYTGEILVVLYNTNVRKAFRDALEMLQDRLDAGHGACPDLIMNAWDRGGIEFLRGHKVAQLVIQDVWVPTPAPGTLEMIHAAIAADGRGEKGFGSTGT